MPKLVDHNTRREEIARATWTVIQKYGVDGVRLRDIADQVGFTTGVFSHYFRDKGSLLRYAFNLAFEHINANIASSNKSFSSGLKRFRDALVALVPDNRSPESIAFVSMCFGIRNLNDPMLIADYKKKRKQYSQLLKSYLSDAAAQHEIRMEQITSDTLDLPFAVLDGVCIAALQNPSSYPRKKAIKIIDTMIDDLIYRDDQMSSAN